MPNILTKILQRIVGGKPVAQLPHPPFVKVRAIGMPHVAASAPACQCAGFPTNDQVDACFCTAENRAIRAFAGGGMLAMTAEQRQECLDELATIEGFSRPEDAAASDVALAQRVRRAWGQRPVP
jgi:hypothetical protein